MLGLGLNMLWSVAGDDKNGVIAPTSLGEVLGMLLEGANGGTGQEIFDALTNGENIGIGQDEIACDIHALNVCEGVICANAIYVTDTINRVRDKFKSALTKYFETDLQTLPFASDLDWCEDVINRWIT
jgi:serine protease inhibitor